MSTIFKIKGAIQHYSWGGYNFIPQLLGVVNTEQAPFAEYWLGAHPNHPSFLEKENSSLAEWLALHPNALGKSVLRSFSSLPFLLKILDVRQMLSIQVHPDKKSAAIEFKKENEKGIPLTAPHRNYKDDNHKPELMVALSDFWLLHGFKDETSLRKILQEVPEFYFLKDIFDKGGYKALYEEVMAASQEKINQVLKPVVDAVIPLYQKNQLDKEDERYWVARAALSFCKNGNYDRGIFSIYFFNLVHLKKGEGIFQPEGMPHAYLEGQNVEVMANSDNVLRAGLTDKHIDVLELMKHVHFTATFPEIITPAFPHRIFYSPAKEFELHQCLLDQNEERVETKTAEIWIVISGSAEVQCKNDVLELHSGEAFFASSDALLSMKSEKQAELFRVLVPDVTKNKG